MQIGNNTMFKQSPLMGLNKIGAKSNNVVAKAISDVQNMLPQNEDTTTDEHIKKIYELEKSNSVTKESETIKPTSIADDFEDIEFNGMLDYNNSSMNGVLSKTEWAEASLNQQFKGLESVYNELYYQTEKVNLVIEKMAEYESIMNGTNTDTDMTVEEAEKLYNAYAQSLDTDFTEILEDRIDHNVYQSNEYDKRSDGLASQITTNPLNSLSAEKLGLTNLSGDPNELLEALNKAYEAVGNLINNFSDGYASATGKEITLDTKTSLTQSQNQQLDNFVNATEREANSRTPEEIQKYLESLLLQDITIAEDKLPESHGFTFSAVKTDLYM